MSRDTYIFLKAERFPLSTWGQILELFCAKEVGALKWVTEHPVRLSAREIGATHWKFGTYRWEIALSYQSPYDVHKLWATVAIPYHCLVLIEQATYHSQDGHGDIEDAAELKRYAETFLIRHTSLQKLVKHGYMDAKKNLTLDSAHGKPMHATALGNAARKP